MIRETVWAGCLSVLLLSACGGGGNGGGSFSSEGPYTLSGTIAVAETALVDSDTNDINQTGRSGNNTANAAQPVTSPLTLVGTVNKAQTGPAGATYFNGDEFDYFRVALAVGQVVELEFSADPADTDLDLHVLSIGGTIVGASNGRASRYECVEITTAATYLVRVSAFRSASIYNLRIGAPGSATTCQNHTMAAAFNPNFLLAQPKAQAVDAATSLQRNAGLARMGSGVDAGPQLLQLPATAELRAEGLKALSGSSSIAKTLDARSLDETVVALPSVLAALDYAKALEASGAYDYVQPNWIMQRHALTGVFPPADRNYSYQRWHYEQINLPSAMSRIDGLATKPTLRPVVAVIDDGVMLDHPDIAPQLYSAGCTFVTGSQAACTTSVNGDNVATAGDNAIFHGTHVAGTIAAATFEPNGGAGVAPMAQILPLRVFSPTSGGASSLDIIQAMRYAAALSNNSGSVPARRADVINLSLGSDRSCDAAYQNVINLVRTQGTMVVVSAGNSGRNDLGQRVAVGSPANCTGAISVSATDARKSLAYYSNTGNALTLAAPGGDSSQSTTGNGAPDSVYSDIGSFDASGTRQPSFGGMMGTSMAAPHVAGVLALMRYVNPALTPTQVDTLISSGDLTDDLGDVGRDVDFGWGLINARKAVDAALAATANPPPEPPIQIVASPSTLDFGSFQTSATFDLQAAGATSETVVSITSNSGAVTVTPVIGSNGGLGRYTVDVQRSLLPTGSSFPRLTVTLSPARTLFIQLSVTKLVSGTGARVGDYGPVYVLLIDPATQNVLATVLATRNATSGYSWSFSGFPGSSVAIVAGGDLDNDDVICQRGEPCGGYPVLSPTGDITAIDLTGNRTDLNFQVAPLSGISAQSAGAGAAGAGWRRTPLSLP
jgi:serine protease